MHQLTYPRSALLKKGKSVGNSDPVTRQIVRDHLKMIETAKWAARNAGESLLEALCHSLYYGGDLAVSDTSLALRCLGYEDLLVEDRVTPAVVAETLRRAEKELQVFVDPEARAKGYTLKLKRMSKNHYCLGIHRPDHTAEW